MAERDSRDARVKSQGIWDAAVDELVGDLTVYTGMEMHELWTFIGEAKIAVRHISYNFGYNEEADKRILLALIHRHLRREAENVIRDMCDEQKGEGEIVEILQGSADPADSL